LGNDELPRIWVRLLEGEYGAREHYRAMTRNGIRAKEAYNLETPVTHIDESNWRVIISEGSTSIAIYLQLTSVVRPLE